MSICQTRTGLTDANDPRQTAIYAAGAGLGASKAKDITKLANDYSGYVSLVKDAVRLPFPVCLIPISCLCPGPRAIWELRTIMYTYARSS